MHSRRSFCIGPVGFAAAAIVSGKRTLAAPPETVGSNIATWELRIQRRVTVAAGDILRHRAFPGIEKLRNGDLLVAYREGTDHWATNDGQVKLVRSSDGGKTWSAPRTVVAIPGKNFGTHSGIAQLSDGTILLPAMTYEPDRPWGPEFKEFNAQSNGTGPRRITSYLVRSTDNGQTWTQPESPDVDGLSKDFWWNCYGKIVQIENTDTVVWPVTRQKKGEAFWRTGLLVSSDLGRTWSGYRDIATHLADEKNFVYLGERRWLCLIRDLKKPYFLHQVESGDNGITWTEPRSTGFYGHCPCLIRTRRGVLLAAHRNLDPNDARGVGLHYSFDEGASWHKGACVYISPDKDNFDTSYPSFVQLDNGEILCAYYTVFRQGNSQIEAAVLAEA